MDVGKEQLQIVCGAPNVAAGQKVPVGRVGATVPRNQHDPNGPPFVLQKVKLRGVESSGMICSAFELDLGKDADGILVLDPKAKTGQPLAKYLGVDDVVYDIEITPNRPDWLSHFGFAREIRLLTGKPVTIPKVRVKEGKVPIRKYLRITVERQEELSSIRGTDDSRSHHQAITAMASGLVETCGITSAQQCRGHYQFRHARMRASDARLRLRVARECPARHPAGR